MKSVIRTVIIAILGIVIIMMITTTHGRMNRSMEVKSNISQAMESTMTQMKLKKSYDIANVDEFIADFTQGVIYSVDAVTNITTEVTNVDKEKGLLSIRVTGTFMHPNGNEGRVSEERTVVLNKILEEDEETYTVKYYLTRGETMAYKEYTVLEGDYVPAPADPIREGLSFTGWTSDFGYSTSQPVSCNMEFYGLWH